MSDQEHRSALLHLESMIGPRRGWVAVTPDNRHLLEAWAILRGVPEEKVAIAWDSSLARAYNDRSDRYLTNWIGGFGRRRKKSMPKGQYHLKFNEKERLAKAIREHFDPERMRYKVGGMSDMVLAERLGAPYTYHHVRYLRNTMFGTRNTPKAVSLGVLKLASDDDVKEVQETSFSIAASLVKLRDQLDHVRDRLNSL